MLLSLKNAHKKHLSLLFNQSAQVLVDFCKLATDFVKNGLNLKLFNTAAQKVEVDLEDVQNCVYGLIYLLLESCKHKLNEVDFRDSVLTAGFTPEQQSILSKFYSSEQKNIVELLSKLVADEPHYHDLNWRVGEQMASPSLLHKVTPLIYLDLVLKNGSEEVVDSESSTKHILLQTDLSNLLHITELLETALIESRSCHSR